MQRPIVLVFTLATLATATPHGYGVKGGASAKAEASAVAGAFGNLGPIPLSIPSGSAYSGSFAKSSSSSFASSSASSSSSSYSFSGSGANGIAGIGNAKGCSSGTCPEVGGPGTSSNGVQQLPGNNALSIAEAKSHSGSYSPCQASNCNDSPAEKCTSGQCLTDSSQKDQNGCTDNCQQNSPSSETETTIQGAPEKGEKEDVSNDFLVNIHGNSQEKLSQGSSQQNSNKEKSNIPGSGCSNGNCGLDHSHQNSLGNNQNHQTVPSTYLTLPNEKPLCSSPDCKYSSHNNNEQTGGLPSSYNVPLQSATNPPNTYYSSPSSYSKEPTILGNTPGIPCTSPNCNFTPNNVGSHNIPSYHHGQQGPSIQGSCVNGQCDSDSSSNGKPSNSGIFGGKPPGYPHGTIPSHVSTDQSNPAGCKSPYCSGLPSYSSQPSNQPVKNCNGAGCGSTPLISSSTKPSDSNAPVYTGGFGGPPGFLEKTPTANKLPGYPTYNNDHDTPSTSGTTGAFGSTPIQGSVGSTIPNQSNYHNHYDSTQTSSQSGSTGTFEHSKPNNVPPSPGSQFKPSNLGNYGTPTASSAVPLGTSPLSENSGIYKPSTSHTGSSPSYSADNSGSTDLSHTNTGSNSYHGSVGVTKPNTSLNSQNSPPHTGISGGPSVTVDGPHLSFGSTETFNKPGTGNCGSLAGCNNQPETSGGTTSYDKTTPSVSSSSQNKPTYTGGFGGPTGFLNPHDFKVPSNTPLAAPGTVPCVSGNCGPKGPAPSNLGGSSPNVHNLAAATASADAVAYSGGFGGPPGFLTPYDNGKVNIPNHKNFASGHSPATNSAHPDLSSISGKSLEPGTTASGANAVAQASATALAGAGSFGGNNGATRGCNTGCGATGAGDGSHGFPFGSAQNGLNGSIASAKSNAGANAFGFGGSFAGSSASAHSTAGAATKGGYGRK